MTTFLVALICFAAIIKWQQRKWIVLVLVAASWGCDDRKCLRSHKERTWMPATVVVVQAGSVSVPLVTPGYWYEADVCDKWEEPLAR